jgi:hypothetical protein
MATFPTPQNPSPKGEESMAALEAMSPEGRDQIRRLIQGNCGPQSTPFDVECRKSLFEHDVRLLDLRAADCKLFYDFDHRITNATSDGLNSKIQTVKKLL